VIVLSQSKKSIYTELCLQHSETDASFSLDMLMFSVGEEVHGFELGQLPAWPPQFSPVFRET
jgi:hypothetical protein